MLTPWSIVETFPAKKQVRIPTKDGKYIPHGTFVEENIPEANDKYWYYNHSFIGSGDLQSILAGTKYQSEYPVWYGRRYFKWSDGAQISVDYAIQIGDNTKPTNWDEDIKHIPQPDTPTLPDRTRILRPEEVLQLDAETRKPIIICVHGLTGGAYENYIRAPFCDIKNNGIDMDMAVFTCRGCNKSKVTTPMFFNGAWTEDLRLYIKHIIGKQPNRPIFLVGYSMGGSILANYLGQEGDNINPQIKAAVVVGNPWDLHLWHMSMAECWASHHIFDKAMAEGLLEVIKDYSDVFNKSPILFEQIPKLKNIKTVREFDEIITAPLFGFSSYHDYCRKASSVNRLPNINIPTLVLAARDDPICRDVLVPYADLVENPFTHLVTTTHGGHLGWFQQDGKRWHSQVILKYVKSFLELSDLSRRGIPTDEKNAKPWFRDGKFQFEPELHQVMPS